MNRQEKRATAAKLKTKDRQRTSATVANFAKNCNRADTIAIALVRVAEDGGVDLVRRGDMRALLAALAAVAEAVSGSVVNDGIPSAEAP